MHGNDAAIADASPLNILTSSASLTKSLPFLLDAYILVLIESIGKIAMSQDMPAQPPAIKVTKNDCSVKSACSAIN